MPGKVSKGKSGSRAADLEQAGERTPLTTFKAAAFLPVAEKDVKINFTENPVLWVKQLSDAFSPKFLVTICLTNHLLKGFVAGGGDEGLLGKPVEFIFAGFGIAGGRLQVLRAVALAPWALKPVIGILSDTIPMFGYRKMPYLVITAIISSICCLAMGLHFASTVPLVVLCLFFMFLQVSTADLLVEAKQSEEVKDNSKLGPELFTFTWMGINGGQVCGVMTVGLIIQNMGPRVCYLIAAPLCALCIVPAMLNWLGETRLPVGERGLNFARITENPVLVGLTLLMGSMVFMLMFGTFAFDETTLFIASIFVAIAGLTAFTLFMRWEIAGPVVFWFLLGLSSLNIDGAAFYFYTDSSDAYPAGPHFTPYFYTAGIGMATFGGIFVGFATGGSIFGSWSYRSLLFSTILLRALTQLLMVPFFLRWNVKAGIPDHLWVMVSIALDTMVFAWRWIPKQVMGAHLTTKGNEATVLALNAGTFNLSMVLSSYLGGFMLHTYGIRPTGAPGEGLMFSSLWKAQVTAALMPLLVLGFLPWLIPAKTQTESLILEATDSATHNSPFERCQKRRRQE